MINGHGYPKRHYDRDCHKASKLVHVCDVFDALRTRRPYRDAWESAKALSYLEERAGTEFEPEAATAFVAMMRKAESGIQLSPMPEAPGNATTIAGQPAADSTAQSAGTTSMPLGKPPEGAS
jgi:HD-GYP domain-containing protein (c-di-GMP phosphodiesterase class II)